MGLCLVVSMLCVGTVMYAYQMKDVGCGGLWHEYSFSKKPLQGGISQSV